jgi:uncharacterized phosphosugar-binding protein
MRAPVEADSQAAPVQDELAAGLVQFERGIVMAETANLYFRKAIDTIQQVIKTQGPVLDQAAQWIADSIKDDGVLHVFGAGHSMLMGQELAFRAGGLAPVNAILDINYSLMGGPPSGSTALERLEGYAKLVLDRYDLRPGEVLIVVSQSGRNPAPIEAAMQGKNRGLKVIALTSLEQSSSAESRHSSGKRLFEVADLVIDSRVVPGDACMEIAPGLPKSSPLSTVVCAAILQALVAEVAKRLHDVGVVPPIWTSANVPGGDKSAAGLAHRYGGKRLKSF